MKRFWRLITGAVVGILATGGVGHGAGHVAFPARAAQAKIAQVTSKTPLYLEHARTFGSQAVGLAPMEHGSHVSHGSHGSHASHVSHTSSS